MLARLSKHRGNNNTHRWSVPGGTNTRVLPRNQRDWCSGELWCDDVCLYTRRGQSSVEKHSLCKYIIQGNCSHIQYHLASSVNKKQAAMKRQKQMFAKLICCQTRNFSTYFGLDLGHWKMYRIFIFFESFTTVKTFHNFVFCHWCKQTGNRNKY